MGRSEALAILARHRHELDGEFRIASLALFGSVARDEARPDSDVDILVEFRETPGLETFVTNEMMYDAVLYNLQILGEAAKKIPDTVRKRYPDIDWRGVAGLRDVLSHAYFAVDNLALWKIVNSDVPLLVIQLERIEPDLP